MTALGTEVVVSAGDGNGTTLVLTKHASVVSGYLQVLTVYYEHGTGGGAAAVAGGATWTLANRIQQLGPGGAGRFAADTFIQVAGGSEPATYTVSYGGGAIWRSGSIVSWPGGDTTTPQDATATGAASASSSASAVAPGLTPVTGDAEVVYLETDFDGRTVTPPTGTTPTLTEHTDFANLHVSSGTLATAAATGDKTGTLASASWNTAQLVALRPAVPGGGTPKSLVLAPPLQRYLHLLVR